MKKFHSVLLACFISAMNFSCADSDQSVAPLTLASAGSSGKTTSEEAGSSGSSGALSAGNGGFAGSMAGSSSSSGEGGSSSGSSGSSAGTAGSSGSQNTGGNAGNPTQTFGGSAGNEVGGSSSSGEDYSVHCSKDTPVQAKVGSNKGFGYSFNNPMTQENYCNPVCLGVGAEKSIMYSFTGKDAPSPDYGECLVVDVGANGFKACCDVIVCRATIGGCTTTDDNKTGDLYSCPGGDHVPPKQNCQVKISNATYNNLGDKEVDIGYSQFCCAK